MSGPSEDGLRHVMEFRFPWFQVTGRVGHRPPGEFGLEVAIYDDDDGRATTRGFALTPGLFLDERRGRMTARVTPAYFVRARLVRE